MTVRRVVVVSRDPELQRLVQRIAQELFAADDGDEGLDIVRTVEPDLVVLDLNWADCHDFISRSKKACFNIPLIVIGTDTADHRELSSEFARLGAYDYIPDRRDADRLQKVVNRLTNQPEQKKCEDELERFFLTDFAASVGIVGKSKAVRQSLEMIKLVAESRCNPVLVVGETGTGKELAAKAIHQLRHPDRKFVAVNCAALTATLLESELFGHVKGAFTGADREKTGLLELTGSGTIFLDEISEIPPELQAKLLRVLQEKTFRKVGGVEDIKCQATIIASSNRDLKEQVRAKRFRADLYYRLNICPVYLAPLRAPERREDIPLLAEYFLKTSTVCPDKTEKIKSLTKLAVEALQKHNWLGNVRELRNVIEKAILLEKTDKIGLSSIIIDSLEEPDRPLGNLFGNQRIEDFSLAKAERELIIRALQETGWQKTRAAALLGITRATLYAKVKQYDISKESISSRRAGQAALATASSSAPLSPEPISA